MATKCSGYGAGVDMILRGEAGQRFSVVTRPGTCIEGGEQHIPLSRVEQIITNLPPGEILTVRCEAAQHCRFQMHPEEED